MDTMKNKALNITISTAVLAAFGAFLRWLQNQVSFELDTGLAKAGIPDGVIQSIVNWESADMVRLYKDIDADEEIGMYFQDGEIRAPDRKTLGDL